MPDHERATRVAVVGTGGWGRQHARVFSAHLDAELVAVCGRNAERAEARAREFHARGYTDLLHMLEREAPDLVTVCLPNEEHFGLTLQLIEAGIPLLVEKPLVFDLAEADRLVDEAQRRGLFFAINFNHRYARPVQMAYEAVQAGRLGPILFASWRFGGEGASRHPHANLIETQCHGFDMLEHLCGPIESLMAQMTGPSGMGDSTHVLALRFACGAVGALIGSYDSSYAYPETHRVELNGAAGRVVIDDTVRRYRFHAAGHETGEIWEAGYFNDFDREFQRTFDRHASAILAAFRAGAPPPIAAEAGRRALALAMAAIESHETGRRITVQEARSSPF